MTNPTTFQSSYTDRRDRDGCDETWDGYTPTGDYLLSIPFWEQAVEAEAVARMVVLRLTLHNERVAAVDVLLHETIEMDVRYGIGLTEGEEEAAAVARAVVAKARPA